MFPISSAPAWSRSVKPNLWRPHVRMERPRDVGEKLRPFPSQDDRASNDALLGSPHDGDGRGRCGQDAKVALVDVSRPPAPPSSTLYGTTPSMCVFDPCGTCIVTMPRSCPLPRTLVPVPKGTPHPACPSHGGVRPNGTRWGSRPVRPDRVLSLHSQSDRCIERGVHGVESGGCLSHTVSTTTTTTCRRHVRAWRWIQKVCRP